MYFPCLNTYLFGRFFFNYFDRCLIFSTSKAYSGFGQFASTNKTLWFFIGTFSALQRLLPKSSCAVREVGCAT